VKSRGFVLRLKDSQREIFADLNQIYARNPPWKHAYQARKEFLFHHPIALLQHHAIAAETLWRRRKHSLHLWWCLEQWGVVLVTTIYYCKCNCNVSFLAHHHYSYFTNESSWYGFSKKTDQGRLSFCYLTLSAIVPFLFFYRSANNFVPFWGAVQALILQS